MSSERFCLNQKVVGKVVNFNQPYFDVMVGEQLGRVFIKNMDTRYLTDVQANELVGEEFEFVIEEIVENADKTYPGIILNRRILIEDAIKKQIEQLNIGDDLIISELEVNKGGLNFNYNHIRGFIPLKEISYRYYNTSEDALKNIELPVSVKITSIELIGGIYNIVGSIKANLLSPLERIKEIRIGDEIIVEELTPNRGGANFMYNDTRGFIPLKELSHSFSRDAISGIKKTELPVKVKVTQIEHKGLFVNIIGSIRATTLSPEDMIKDLNIGDVIEISEFSTNSGGLCFIYNTIRGFVPLSEVSHRFYSTSESALYDLELPAKVEVREIGENRGQLNIVGSIKANLDDLYTVFTRNTKLNSLVDATIIRQEEYGYIIQFDNGYTTLLHISQFSDDIKQSDYTLGDTVSVKLVNILNETKQVQVTTLSDNTDIAE